MGYPYLAFIITGIPDPIRAPVCQWDSGLTKV